MLKQEFLDSLRRSLVGNLEYHRVEEHIRYYTDYIDSQMRQGVSEEKIMEELGDPRLIAKTLVGVGEKAFTSGEYVEEERTEKKNLHSYNFNGKNIVIPAWLSSILLGAFLVVVLGLFFALLGGLLHLAFPILMVIFAIRMISKIFRG